MKYLFFDLRALGLMRICIALVIILDLSIRISDLEAFYTNTGAAPLQMLFGYAWNNQFISLHTISGAYEIQFLLFLLSYFFAFLLFIGYRTQLFTFLSWAMMVSLHNRNGLILQGGDDLLRMILFWSIFIPWGRRYSFDSIKSVSDIKAYELRTPAVLAYLFQICYLYSGSALLKGVEWNTDFSALYYVYSLDQISYPITSLLYPHPELLKILTALAYYFELLIPLLFFVPFKHGLCRSLGVVLIILFHSLNEIALLIGLFPYIGMATSIGILPRGFMDKFEYFFRNLKYKMVFVFTLAGTFIKLVISYRTPLYRDSIITSGLVIFFMVFVCDWNYSNLHFVKSKLSDDLRFIGYGLRLDQSWGMFAPGVLKDDGWYVLHGESKTKKHMNLMNPQEKLNYNKPKSVTAHFKNDRWRKYYENLMLADHSFMRGYYCSYKTRIWNEEHPGLALKSLEIIYMRELTLADYQYFKPEKNLLWRCDF
ncbi:MAG: HTTM domain-containing protein [Opitutaceae bacterium]|nr:HTTM domain-containing protein [Cytophagales bacterium]